LVAAAAALSVAGAFWWSLGTAGKGTSLPFIAFDAIAARAHGQWLVARELELLLYDSSAKPRMFARLSKPLISLCWTDATLYGIDRENTLLLWEKPGAPPKTFSLDHAPQAIFARTPHVWTLDETGNLRQFILAVSMTGVFLQPLDRVDIGRSGDFTVAEDGSVLLLDRSTGELLHLTRVKSQYVVAAKSASYGAGARLAASGRAHWITSTDAKGTALVHVTPPTR
jgi:hypothetical protein